ncbi:hypothetical protein GCM10009841_31460 [Microlunatus panaciterrae]|uniref:Membrane protein YphA (DoxX/SURF4 family) n=1 Tax=Microlunatus panaciterrae TaxID=400768 RepID=A0ABS2RHW5_9ACTN|nr:DoxX-like family protein [Microlunatus panaciterrae]MBM7797806.1 putative membrane protein YphA (DoxX/SURF4 family) [Microlunatus panaciterrae]
MPSTGPVGRGLVFFGQLSIALVWLYAGLVAKLLGLRPDDRAIIDSVPFLAPGSGGWVTMVIGGFEVLLAIWVIFGGAPRVAAVVQTLTLVVLTAIDLTYGRRLVGEPVQVVITQLALVALIWLVAVSLSHLPKRGPSPFG